MKQSWVTLFLVLFGCGGASPGPTADSNSPPVHAAASAPSGPILMSVRGVKMAKDRTARGAFYVNDALQSGDYFAYYVRVDKAAYVYVLQFSPDNRAKVLFPDGDPAKIEAGKESRIPTESAVWFQLDQTPGQEYLYIVASSQRLEIADPALAAIVQDIRVSSQTPAPSLAPSLAPASTPSSAPSSAPRPAPHPAPPRARSEWKMPFKAKGVNTVRISAGDVSLYQAHTGDDGVGVMPFPFEHR